MLRKPFVWPALFLLLASLFVVMVHISAEAQPPVINPAKKTDISAPINKPQQVPLKNVVKTTPTPFQMVQLASEDIIKLPPKVRPYIRYLSLNNIPEPAKRKIYCSITSFVVNSLSRKRIIIKPAIIPDINNPLLIRLNIQDYTWESEVWDSLAEKGSGPNPRAEPYFQITQVTDVVIEKKLIRGKGKKVYLTAPWIKEDGGKAINLLIKETESQHPILRCDWFIAMSTQAPIYYDFLELGDKEADFDNLALADLKKSKRSQIKAAVAISDVTLHDRFLVRDPTLSGRLIGSIWKSLDYTDSVDDRDVLLNILNEVSDAKELIASLRNGLHFYFVVNKQGSRLDLADPAIALDYLTTLKDKKIYVASSCMTCHANGSGIRKINDVIRNTSRGDLKLLSSDPKTYQKIEDLFSFDIDVAVTTDQAYYTAAVKAATDLTPQELSKELSSILFNYIEAPLTIDVVANEIGYEPIQLKAKLKKAANLDPRLLGFLQDKPLVARRDQYEVSALPNLMAFLSSQKKDK